MKVVLAGAVAAVALAGASLLPTAPARAQVNIGISFHEGDVMYAYRDGWWDHGHRWHPWRSEAERIWWRDHYHDRYWDWRHDRDPDMGWRVGATMGGPGVGIAVGVPGISFAVTDVAFAYRDGWWDHGHHWHPWRNEAERIWWRDHYHDHYWDWRHDRDPHMGWHS